MNEELELIKKRIQELARKADLGGYYTFTDFLGLSEQSAFKEILPKISGIKYTVFGGTDGAERIMVRFGDAESLGYETPFPIVPIKIEPLSQKFADKLTHRDFLGSILNLGIERSTLGDIVILDNIGYLFAHENVAEYITDTLSRIKHTDVKAKIADRLPAGDLYKTEPKKIQISSERLDAVIAKVYSMSRDDAQGLFKKHLVYVDGRLTESVSAQPKAGCKVSVRGHGRFIYRGFGSLSKKGKLNAICDVYI